MSVSISGILLDPFGEPASFAEVKFITWQGANDVLTTAPAVFKTSSDGAYSFAVEFGTFTVQVRYNQSNGKFQTIKQKVVVNSNVTATTLGELLLFNEPLTPPEIAYVEQLVAEAEGYKDEAEGFALASEASSQASAVSAAESAQSATDAANSAALIAPVPLNGGVWASGQTYEFYNQYMIYNGEAYSPLPATVLPYTVGAVPDLGFVYQIKLNDHALLSNRNPGDGSSHNSQDINHKSSLVASYVRTALSRLDDLTSAKDVGDIGVGGDDTAGLAALMLLSAKGIYFPEGTYRTTGLTFASGKRYVGAGMDSTKLLHTGAGGDAFSVNGSYSQFENMTLSGNGVDTARTFYAKSAFFMSWLKNVRVEQGVINVYLESSWTFTLDGCQLRGAGNDDKGITVSNIYTDGWESGVLHNSRVEDCLGDNIVIDQILGPATNFFTISGSSKLQRCGGRALHAKVGQGKVHVYIERANDDNTLDLPLIQFDAGGFTEIENTYITNSGALSKGIQFTGNTLLLSNIHQSSSGGVKGLDIGAGVDAVIQLGGRVLGVNTIPSSVRLVDMSQLSNFQFRDGSLLVGNPANLDSSQYALDVEAVNKNTRVKSTANFKELRDNPANRRNDRVYLSDGVEKIYEGQGDADELGDSVWYVGPASNNGVFTVDVVNRWVRMIGIPTSSAGLPTGTLWKNGNSIDIT